MKTTLLVAILSLSAVGCASSSGVHRIGDDSFTVTVEASPAKGGRVAAQRMAYEEAGQACAPRQVERVAEIEPERVWGQTASQLRLDFRCVDPVVERMLRAAPTTCADMNPEARAALRCTP